MKRLTITAFIITCLFAKVHAQTADTAKVKRDTASIKNITADGFSYDGAIVITEKTERTGTPAEYAWIRTNYPNSKVTSQSLNYHNKKPYDILHIINSEGVALNIYFDISNFFGKF